MKVYMIRHGETDANKQMIIQGRTNNPLNKTGIMQAKKTGQYLKSLQIPFDYCMTSPLDRAIHTADIIKKELNLNLETHIEKDIIERDFGAYDGRVIDDTYQEAVHGHSVPGLETDQMIEKRVADFFNKFFKNNHYENVLMITHAHVLKALLVQNLIGFSYDEYLVNCSINIIEYKDKIKVIEYNIDPINQG